MKPVDEPVRFIEFVPQTRHPAACDQRGVALNTSGADLRGLDLLRDLVDVRVQRLQEFSGLGRVGVIDHVGIIAPTATVRATGPIEQITQPEH